MTLCMDRFARFEFITHSNAFFHSPMRGRQRDRDRGGAGEREREGETRRVKWSGAHVPATVKAIIQ